jgi:uncharacterized protein YhhL (DUF1145 family)
MWIKSKVNSIILSRRLQASTFRPKKQTVDPTRIRIRIFGVLDSKQWQNKFWHFANNHKPIKE